MKAITLAVITAFCCSFLIGCASQQLPIKKQTTTTTKTKTKGMVIDSDAIQPPPVLPPTSPSANAAKMISPFTHP